MSAEVYDIETCPVCNGMASIIDGQKMYNNQVYDVRKPCPNPKCHYGRVGILRKERVDYGVDYEIKNEVFPFPT